MDTGQPTLSSLPILLAEDEALIAMQVEDMLDDAGLGPVLHYGDVARALDAASDQRFRAALLDISLAGELIWPVADVLADRGVPFILCSGNSMDLPVRHAAAPCLTKPYGAAQLSAALELIGVAAR
jgi:CheY-like chemotaxis protein